MSFAQAKQLLFKTYEEWSADQAPRLGAALAYYTTLSLAPLLLLLIAVIGLIFGQEAASGKLFSQIDDMVGPEGAKAIAEIVKSASKPSSGILASVIAFATLLFGASSVATELRNALNIIWNNPAKADTGILDMFKESGYALGVVLGCGFLLVVSLVASSGLAAGGAYLNTLLPLPEIVLQIFNLLLSILVLTGVFAVLFKYLPDVKIQWRDVLLGAFATSVLFSLGKTLIGLYLGKASFGSTYGAAGSLVIILVWIYYSSQIFFFGAEFTQVYAASHGSKPNKAKEPKKPVIAIPAPDPAREVGSKAAGSLLGSALVFSKIINVIFRK